ncbi:SOS response-associated peptidase [Leeia oryzae]|uniref:SOS response-associated peptidase n=1 Tax=Leeia oryzae TaxID=356662 RepID=UPI0003606F28|nr:SOS response-associated peptidase family protein [Leeia oryzae]
MCVNFIPPSPQQLREHFKVQLDTSTGWPTETWQDYAAPIILQEDGTSKAVLASFGMIPKQHLPAGVRISTMNARAETIGQLKTYRHAWHNAHLCLVPMLGFFEPCYESGKAERWKISMADGEPFAVAGLWRAWNEAEGDIRHSFTQITINADEHPLMKRMHKPGDEKRSLVIVPADQYQDWLNCKDSEVTRSFLALYPSTKMAAQAVPRKTDKNTGNLNLF